jgi:predicted metalloprotease with PDZ domain
LTFVVFFLNAEEKVYARYGGRDGTSADARQSLDGLHYTMQSVLDMHQREDQEFAPRKEGSPKYIRQIAGGRGGRGCYHCHQVREALNAELKRKGQWSRELAWRYPLPDNLGLILDVNRGNVVQRVEPDSAAARAGLRPGDRVQKLNGVPIHSLGDAQFALDRAPSKGEIPLTWQQNGEARMGTLALVNGWRKSDIAWRPSLLALVPSLPLYGSDLTAAEKQALGLAPKQLAFRLKSQVHSRVKAAGIQGGDVVLGVDSLPIEGTDVDLHYFVRRQYLVGDQIMVNLIRDGKRLDRAMTLR